MEVLDATRGGVEHARSLYFAGNYGEALRAAEVLISSCDLAEQVGGLLLKACIQSEHEQFSECLDTLKVAGPLIDHAPAKSRAAFHGQRAFARVKVGRKKDALIDYEAARVYAQESGDQLAEGTVRNNLAGIYSQLGRFDDAITESDNAILMFRKLNEHIYLGRAYDQRAQILNNQGLYSEAITWSEKALGILGKHPAAAEARMTHGSALIGLGESYLDHPDPVENFRVRRSMVNMINLSLGPDVVQLALDRCEGNVLRASVLLNVKHQSLQGAVNRFKLKAHQNRIVRRSIIKK
jgi:tetratricopeptide (TPR) repeat protein